MALSAINRDTDPAILSDVVNRLVQEFNRQDTRIPIFGTETGTSTAYAIAPIPGITQYRLGEIFVFKAVNANTSTTPTLNVDGKGAGTISKASGALALGDIAANAYVEVLVTSISPVAFQLLSPTAFVFAGATTFLGGDIGLTNVATFFSGPNTGSIGANGQTWEITAKASVKDTAGAAGIVAQIFDGTNPIDSGTVTTGAAQFEEVIPLGVIVALSAPTTFTLRAKDVTSVNGLLLTTGASGATNKATSISAKRLA